MATSTATIRAPTASEQAAILLRPPRSLWSNAWYKLRRDRLTMIAFGVLILFALLSAGADLFAQNVFHYTFEKQDLLNTYQKPTLDPPAFLLGSDEIGRSQVVRLLYGGRVSLAVGFVSVLGLVIGVMALVISMALMTGYRGDLQRKLLGGNAEIFVYSVGGPIADTDRLADAALAGVAGALLAVDLAGRAGDLAAGLRPDRALPLVRVVHDQRLLQQVGPHLAAEPLLVHLQRVDLLAGLVEYGDFNHLWSFVICPSSLAGPVESKAGRE